MTHLIAATLLLGAQANYDWHDIVQKNFRDAYFVARAVKASQKELKKINKDFAYSYQFDTTTAHIKEPFKLRLDAKVDDATLMYILVGGKKYFNVDDKIKGTDDVSRAPGKQQTLLDFGMLTPSLFQELFVGKFVRVDRDSGDLVFDLTYQTPKFDDTSRHRVWVDKDKKFIKKRVWFSQEGNQLATFTYDNPKSQDGVWFPTRCTVRNNDDVVAGVTEYQKMEINKGIPDSIFKW